MSPRLCPGPSSLWEPSHSTAEQMANKTTTPRKSSKLQVCLAEVKVSFYKIVTNSYACKTLRSKRCYVGSVMLKPHGFSVGHVFRVKAFTRCSDNSKRVKNLHLGSRVSRSGGILFSVRTSVISPGGVQTVFIITQIYQ